MSTTIKVILTAVITIQAGCMTRPSFDPIRLSVAVSESNHNQQTFIVTSEPTDRRTARAIEAENIRLEWMNRWVERNHLCPQGYTVINRSIDKKADQEYQVNYLCRCL